MHVATRRDWFEAAVDSAWAVVAARVAARAGLRAEERVEARVAVRAELLVAARVATVRMIADAPWLG
jgi:hypothetical protein